MKLIKNIYTISILMLAIVMLTLISACEVDKYTGDSIVVPTNPTISVEGAGDQGTFLDGEDHVHTISLSMDMTQVVDVAVHVTQTDGDAVEGVDYSLSDSRLMIKSGATSASLDVTILTNPGANGTRSFTITIGDAKTANADITPVTATFTIDDYLDGDLIANMSWAASETTTDNSGNVIPPTQLADLRLLLSDELYDGTNAIDGADGGSFETFVLSGDLPDGEYYFSADFYAALESPVRDLNITLTFDQIGVFTGMTFEFEEALSTQCTEYTNYFIMVKVTKSGTDYTIEEVAGYPPDPDVSPLVGTYTGTDCVGCTTGEEPSQVVTQMNVDLTLGITGLGFGWMEGFWGEIVQEQNFVTVDLDWCGDQGVLTIPEQDYIVTLYSGDLYAYTVVGSGTFEIVGGVVTMHVEYDMIQDGFSTAGWMFDNGGMPTELFVADITLP
jgi:hypothetical protein